MVLKNRKQTGVPVVLWVQEWGWNEQVSEKRMKA